MPLTKWLRRIAFGTVIVAALALPVAVLVKMPPWMVALMAAFSDVMSLTLPLRIVVAAEAILILTIAIWWLWWRLPQRQVNQLALKIRDSKARADVEDNLRKTIGQALGGAAVLAGAVVAYLQFTQQQRAAHDLLISNQVAKGFEQLAGDKIAMRLGGIYALEGVMNTSEQYHQPVLEALCAFVREGTKTHTGDDSPATDIQAALTVIGRRGFGRGFVDLTAARIPSADLSGADLSGAHMSMADLHGATLTRTNLRGAELIRTDLRGSRLDRADLRGAAPAGADLSGAHLNEADLRSAQLRYAHLSNAELRDADLSGADLSNTLLRDADVTGADLSGASLRGSRLDRADLSGAGNLTQKELNRACGTDATLPPGLSLLPCNP